MTRRRSLLLAAAALAGAAIDFPKIDKELVKTSFLDYLDFALQFAPAQDNEKDIRAKLARIGVGPSRTCHWSISWSLASA